MKQLTSSQVRTMFLDYFKSKNHMIEPGASLVPINDDTLLWINSGVAALKKYFDGRVKPMNPRIANVQKSIRTNDIDNVGYTARHHTFFEMLGNFSIGDYFKEDAIQFGYEFLFSPNWIGLDAQHMYVSVHTEDHEAYRIWTEVIGIDPKRILKTDDNFWQIGDGPCGPNSEIFYDRGPKYDPENLGERLFFEELENDRYIEVWNIVFSQYDGKEGVDFHEFKELPQKNIDTGMGFERLVSIVQGGETNFDTDLFLPIITETETFTQIKYHEKEMAFRVIADHIRTLVFALNDGALFSNEGRGYVLRRLLRRAARYGRVLDINEPFLYKLVDSVIEVMHDFYTDLDNRPEDIKKLILNEEKRFIKTLQEGEKLLLSAIESQEGVVLPGDVAFKLYDTYGFPIELTQEMAQERGVSVDLEGFDQALEAQKERARGSRQKIESMGSQQEDILNFKVPSQFLYDTFEVEATITGLFVEGHAVETLHDKGLVALDQTPFYAESGGQVSDIGSISGGHIVGVSKANAGQHLHHVEVSEPLHLGDTVHVCVDTNRRILIRKNHSCVHLLHSALHEFVGEHVNQAGSYVDDQYFRFDFTHFERLTPQTLKNIERRVNEWIAQSLPIHTDIMNVEEAKASGAIALFGDTYGDVVRVVSMGDVSKELCGGTHALSTGEIGVFKLVSEESVGSGVRRIVGKTSLGAYETFKKAEQEIELIREDLKLVSQKSIIERIEEMRIEKQSLQEKYDLLLKDALHAKIQTWLNDVNVSKEGLNVLWVQEYNADKELMNEIVDKLRDHVDLLFAVNVNEPNVSFMVSVSPKGIESGYKAGDLAKELAQATGGNGGGRPNFAQSGGKNVSNLNAAQSQIYGKIGI
ncbi:alanine--tRNA ligase [Erysipelothrix larvae]|uniref:Alanine--tRNA ligase n=1 Tax=Erysipelothrix larvae TaxID=1514105 RepID=A0A120JTP9_9FIRM|nr:alanine--tRNA ligase [Erysipelothrix larvae]AMC93555.1 alanine--tRNA ligase [Erysipelothrix larvae]